MTRSVLLVLVASFALACQKPAADTDTPSAAPSPVPGGSTQTPSSPPMTNAAVRVVLDRATYRSRDDVQLTLVNGTQRDLGYNPCTRVVERETAGAWTAVPEPDRVCTMELRLLAAGATVTTGTDLPVLSPGRYRIVLRFTDESPSAGAPLRGASEPFSVQ